MATNLTHLTRRGVLAGAAGTGVALAAPALAQSDGTRVAFTFAPDESGAIQALIDGFNSSQSDAQIVWSKAAEESDAFFNGLVSDLEAGSDDVDVFGADVIWTAELAARNFTQDLSSRIYDALPTQDILSPALASVAFRNRLWGVPWFTDAGMLYYRKDLLEEAGIEPPETWDELAAAAQQITESAGVANGFVFQGARYEGGVTNALEFIWSAGGRAWTVQSGVAGTFGMNVSDPNVIVLDSSAAAAGLARARAFITEGIAPEDVAQFNEREALRVFASGDAVFMRNWPFAYGLIGSGEFGGVSQDQVGIARIPTMQSGGASYSCLGGWNLSIRRGSANLEAAWNFIRYALEPAQQEMMVRQGGFLPVLTPLYEDEALAAEVPVIGLGGAAVASARARPDSVAYSRLSPRLAAMFNRVLLGEVEPEEAVQRTEDELRRIVRQARG